MGLDDLLARSRATDAFRDAVRRYAGGADDERVAAPRYAPRAKVVRVLMQLLDRHPALEIERVALDADAGCSDYVGRLTVVAADGVREVDFAWDCRWRAEQEGWTDPYGRPDQARAAREFGWRCFERWQVRVVAPR